jgi:hypothetical protein
MDLNKIFALFDNKTENKPLTETDNTVVELYEKPLFWVNMFEKLIRNNNVFKLQLKNTFKDDHYDPDMLCEAGDALVYNKAFMFLLLLDLNDEDHMHAIRTRTTYSYLVVALITSMNYFTSTEEYEKCAVIKKILDFAMESLEA